MGIFLKEQGNGGLKYLNIELSNYGEHISVEYSVVFGRRCCVMNHVLGIIRMMVIILNYSFKRGDK